MYLKKEISNTIVLWQVQNDYYALTKTYLAKSKEADEEAEIWLDAFRKLGDTFHMNLESILPEAWGPTAAFRWQNSLRTCRSLCWRPTHLQIEEVKEIQSVS